jgi:hypothetical protein
MNKHLSKIDLVMPQHQPFVAMVAALKSEHNAHIYINDEGELEWWGENGEVVRRWGISDELGHELAFAGLLTYIP